MSKQSSRFIEEQISISIGIQMKGFGVSVDLGYDTVHEAMKQDAEFAKHAESAASCNGGATWLLDKDPPEYEKWAESVFTAPAWINGTTVLRPIADLLVGDNATVKRRCLQEAIIQYMGEPAPHGEAVADSPATAVMGSNGTCSGPLDCNAQHCYDCSCVNSRCTCADGWMGAHCETPFCTNRTAGCSGHGDCHQDLHSISCSCDAGFVGDHCQTATCALKCQHGSTPNGECTSCVGCLGAWSGTLCDKWNESVPVGRLMQQLYAITNATQSMLNAQAQFHPVCKQGYECVGWGVNGVTGAPTTFPVVELTYDPTRTDKTFNGMSEPLEAVSNHVVNPVWDSTDGANTFPTIDLFQQHVDTTYTSANPTVKGTGGIYSLGVNDAFGTYFQRPDDTALSVVRSSKPLISMSLPVDPVTKTRQYNFSRFAHAFVQSLPPTYESEAQKQQFRYFIEHYGTSFATSATLGGRVEQYSSWKTWLTDPRLGGFTIAQLTRNAELDFSATTGLPGTSGEHDPGYTNKTRVLNPLQCMGGDSSTSCDADFTAWAATIADAPVLLDYELAPISDLVSDPSVKASLEAAVQAYVTELRQQWAAQNKCPPGCGGAGSGSCNATAGMSACKCSYNGRAGRMCSACAPTGVKAVYTGVDGKATRTATATVRCGEDAVVWQGNASCTITKKKHFVPCATGGSAAVTCTRSANGNLGVKIHQDRCDDVISSCGPFKGSSSPKPNVSTSSSTITAKDTSVHRRHHSKVSAECEFV